MNLLRIVAGAGLFAVSSWLSTFVAESTGMSEPISYMTIGGILCFAGGMLFYSGVRGSDSCCRC